jgi:hypothetical protein
MGAIEEGLLLVLVVEAEAETVPLAMSRQFVTTLWVRPSDLFAVFIQLMGELNSFLFKTLELRLREAAEEEDEELPPRVLTPLVCLVVLSLLLLLSPFFGAANAI